MKNLKADLINKEIKILDKLSTIFGGVYKPDRPKRIENNAPASGITEQITAVELTKVAGGVYKAKGPKAAATLLSPVADITESIAEQDGSYTP
ncbi:hypothetical protein [Thalassomonas actiniarum]|uniref:Uncharacterized protein n=1 Tax=Thalassomonas actiniarum TaxID=485447 RepID=A0AAE9YTY0_9GAMM|nr:hypothetical protein [Thalassomonas actiniarum]WDE00753.1 hypothetical protein SG35_009030 [Thalassomonas actiniarum]